MLPIWSKNLFINKYFTLSTKLKFGFLRNYVWKSDTIRSSFISFYNDRDHVLIPSSPVVPWNDNTLDFVNAGMNQFKSVLLGEKTATAKRAVNSQKCIRLGGKHNDLADVGRDTYHHTFFEMLGSWSFNDYFKEDACKMSWELLTDVFKISPHHLYVTYFGGDDSLGLKPDEETKHFWLSIGVPKHKVLPFGMKDNFWEMGDIGPCGPCTEIHFERIPSFSGASKVNLGTEDVIEIWNLVFIQFQRVSSGKLLPLQSQFVDTGMGLERITACLNGKLSNYDTDIFQPLLKAVHQMSGKRSYEGRFSSKGDCLDTFYRILADHVRMIAIALSDGLLPHDNYSLRRAIRSAFTIGWEKFGLGSTPNFMGNLVEVVTEQLEDVYPNLSTNLNQTKNILDFEERQLIETRDRVTKDWPKVLEKFPQLSNFTNPSSIFIDALNNHISPNIQLWKEHFPLEEALKLHRNYNLTSEVIEDLSQVFGFPFDADRFLDLTRSNVEEESKKSSTEKSVQKQMASILVSCSVPSTDDSFKYNYDFTEQKGYSYPKHQAKLLALFIEGQMVEEAQQGDRSVFVLDSTNFYPKSGGQENDSGTIESEDNIFKASKVEKIENYSLHYGEVTVGSFKLKTEVTLNVNKGTRLSASKLHTTHHLLRKAIEAVAGMAYQRGSVVNENSLVMSLFVHPPLQLEHLIKAENLVKEWIRQNQQVTVETLSIFEALRSREVCLVSGHKYPDEVRLITCVCHPSPNVKELNTSIKSSELCCGTHVFNTGHIGDFAISDLLENDEKCQVTAVIGKKATKLNDKASLMMPQFHTWSERLTSAIENNERLRELDRDFKIWRRKIEKSQLPITTFNYISENAKCLEEQMEQILITKSNWEELRQEFQKHLGQIQNGPTVYEMKTEYRGPIESLEVIVREASHRPAAFVCRGWGRVRACVYIPEGWQSDTYNPEDILSNTKQIVGGTVKNDSSGSREVATLHINGLKRERLKDTVSQIIENISKIMF